MDYNTTSSTSSTYSELYDTPGFSYSDLTSVEKLWVDWHSYFKDPAVATAVMSFALHEVRSLCSLKTRCPDGSLTWPTRFCHPARFPDCILRPLRPVDDCRCHPVLP